MAASDLQDDYQRVIKDVLPSVVQIDASESLGSGVVYDDKGHVVTNAHVVGKEKTFKVTTATGEQALTAKLVASYPEQDLAVIKLDNPPSGLKPAKFGDSTKAEVGQIVLAMGSPLGLSSSVTQGIVSATGRTVSERRTEGGAGATIANMVQTSAAINPGNSGGALVSLDSEVIGIPTLAATDPQMGDSAAPGIGFAIPSSMVKTVADQIIKDGKVTDSGRARARHHRAVRSWATTTSPRASPSWTRRGRRGGRRPASRRATSSPSSAAPRSPRSPRSPRPSPARSLATRPR